MCNDLADILSFLGVKVIGSLSVKGVADYGAISSDPLSLESAVELGEALYTR